MRYAGLLVVIAAAVPVLGYSLLESTSSTATSHDAPTRSPSFRRTATLISRPNCSTVRAG